MSDISAKAVSDKNLVGGRRSDSQRKYCHRAPLQCPWKKKACIDMQDLPVGY